MFVQIHANLYNLCRSVVDFVLQFLGGKMSLHSFDTFDTERFSTVEQDVRDEMFTIG